MSNLRLSASRLVGPTNIGLRVASMVAKLLLMAFLAQSLGLEGVGIYGLIVGVSVVYNNFSQFGARLTVVRDIASNEENRISIVSDHIIGCILFFALFSLPTFLTISWITSETGTILAIIVIMVMLFECLANECYYLLIALGRSTMANIAFFVRNGLWAYIFIIAGLFSQENVTLQSLMIFWLVGAFAAIVVSLHALNRSAGFQFDLSGLAGRSWDRAKASIGLWIGACALVVSTYVDRFTLGAFSDGTSLGAYVLLWTALNAIQLLVQVGLLQPALPALIRANRENAEWKAILEKSLRKRMILTSAPLLLCGVALLTAAKIAVPGASFIPIPELLIMAVATLVRIDADWQYNTLYAGTKDSSLGLNLAFILAGQIASSALLVSVLGLTGGAISQLCYSLVLWLTLQHATSRNRRATH